MKTLQSKGLPIEWEATSAAPTTLSEQYDCPVMISRYPSSVKAFNTKPDPERPELALGVDVLAPEGYGEIIGGGDSACTWICCSVVSRSTTCRRSLSSGIWTFGGAPCRTGGFGMASSVWWRGLQAAVCPPDNPVPAYAL